MEPQIQYAQTEDGVSIAFSVMGEGPPLLVLLSWATNMELDWKDPECVQWLERMANGRRLIVCGHRGVAPSQQEVSDLSLDAQLRDLNAIVERLKLDRFDLFASYDGAAVAANYAAAHPERLARLVLWAPFARGAATGEAEAMTSLANLMRSNWSFARRAWADLIFPSGPAERGHWYADLLKQSVTSEVAAGYIEFVRDLDTATIFSEIEAPALVLTRSDIRHVRPGAVSAVAASMPDSRFVSLEGDIAHPPLGDISYVDMIAQFLDEDRAAPGPSPLPSGLTVILFADIASSTALTERLGDTAFREKARALDEGLRSAITGAGGMAVEGKLLGDGVLAVFTSARDAIACADACHVAASDTDLQLHVGIHAGDVIREEGNIYGGAVNIAARVADASEAGETLVSQTVRDLARTSAGVAFEDRGEQALKGVSDPVRVWAVRSE